MIDSSEVQTATGNAPAQPSRIFPDADRVVGQMRAAFARAAQECASQLKETALVLGGQPVRLRTVGSKLHYRIKRPLAHLETSLPRSEARSTGLTIELWDEFETGVGCAGFEIEDALDAGKGFIVTISDDSRYVSLRRARLHAVYDRLERRITGWSSNGDRLSLAELGRPMQYLFCYWFHDVKLQLIHSGMIGENGAGIIVAGRSGSGKSTTCLVCLEAGMNYLGDDVLVMSGTKATGFVGHGVYNSNHILPRDADRFPHLKRYVNSGGQLKDDKWVVMLHEAFPGQVLPNLPIRAIALPRIVDQPTSAFRRATKAQALMAIAPSSIGLIEGAMSQSVTRLAELVEHVPAYWVDLGREFRSTPGCIRQLISQVQ
jgi:hypothetical protein